MCSAVQWPDPPNFVVLTHQAALITFAHAQCWQCQSGLLLEQNLCCRQRLIPQRNLFRWDLLTLQPGPRPLPINPSLPLPIPNKSMVHAL